MAWWGKLLGGAFGFVLGGPLGAALGAALGHSFDKGLGSAEDAEVLRPGEQERVQTAFFTATFSVLGHLSKADGRVTPEEIDVAQAVMREMDLSADMRRTAIQLFNQGKSGGFPLDEVLEQFRRECHRRQTLIRIFLEVQLQGAYADGRLDSAEQRLLLHMAERLGFPQSDFESLERMIRAERDFAGTGGKTAPQAATHLDEAYALLGVSPEDSDAVVKKAYRRLLSQHHPDKLVSKGLPEEMMKLAARKTHEIKQAYEHVKAARNMD
jgi:DnaJ like chaperone protein